MPRARLALSAAQAPISVTLNGVGKRSWNFCVAGDAAQVGKYGPS